MVKKSPTQAVINQLDLYSMPYALASVKRLEKVLVVKQILLKKSNNNAKGSITKD